MSPTGSNDNTGDQANPLATLGYAATLATAGTTVHALPGVYREGAISPAVNGRSGAPIRFMGEAGAVLSGSNPLSLLTFTTYSGNIRVADVPINWGDLVSAPTFLIQYDVNHNVVSQYHIARSPNYYVDDEQRYTKYWYQADGGNDVSPCHPSYLNGTLDCGSSTWDTLYLVDRGQFPESMDPWPLDMTKIVPNSDLRSLPDLVGARVYITDGNSGHYIFKRKIVEHDRTLGKIKVDSACKFDGYAPALRVFSKYYVEDKLELLDAPGEFYYDTVYRRLYIYPLAGVDYSLLELSVRPVAFDLSGRSFVQVSGFSIRGYEEYAIAEHGYFQGSHYVDIVNNTISHVRTAFHLARSTGDVKEDAMSQWNISYNNVRHTDGAAIYTLFWSDQSSGWYDVCTVCCTT